MSNYRDDRDALREKARELQAETDRLREEGDAAKRAHEASAQRAERLEAEVEKLRQEQVPKAEEPAKKPSGVAVFLLLAGIIVGVAAAFWSVTVTSHDSAPTVPPPVTTPVWKDKRLDIKVREPQPVVTDRITISRSKDPGELHKVFLKSEPSGAEVRVLQTDIVLGRTPLIVELDQKVSLRLTETHSPKKLEKIVVLDTSTKELVVYFDKP